MSSHRYPQPNNNNNTRQAGGGTNKGGGFTKTQKVFVPKNQDHATTPNPNPTLSASLRQSLSHKSDAESSSPAVPPPPSSNSSGRVRMGEKGEWVSTKGNFVNYLPQDEAVAAGLGAEQGGLDAVEAQRVVDLLNRELSRLLKLSPKEFWKQVASDTSLHEFLDSFLQFRSRWYDFPHRGAKDMVAGVVVGELGLSRRVFMVLYRISSNRDPGARAADTLSSKDHEALLQKMKLLDLPKLLDICAIYSHENEDLTRLLVGNAVKAHAEIHDNLTAVSSHFLSMIRTMYQRSSSALEVLFLSGNPGKHGSSRLLADLLEVMDFINDAIVSMDAFLTVYNPSAMFFLSPVEKSYGNEELLSTLARLHDSFIPSLQQGFQIISAAGEDKMVSNVAISLKMLSMRIVNFGWKLLDICYLSDEVFKDNLPIPAAAEMFPAKLEDLCVRADVLVETLKEINGISVRAQENQNRETFLQNVERNFNILGKVESLQNQGWIIMDDEQLGYVRGILMCSQKVIANAKSHTHTTTPLTNSKVVVDEDAAIIESKISQVKDLFPDYGKGFVAACLEAYNQNPEEVIQRILEGTLHEDLQSLDTSLETMPKPRSASVSRNDKGKGILIESTPTVPATTNTVGASRVQQSGVPSISSSSTQGRFVRKSKADLPVPDSLDDKNEKYSAKTAALLSQFEYEDEYDDSFDDLGLSVGDSGAGEYSEKISSSMGRPWETRMESSSQSAPSSSSKWGSRQKPQYYVKDGKNYSYKVAGSVAVANSGEASLVTQAQQELIHGLGRGGNRPLGAVKKLTEYSEEQEREQEHLLVTHPTAVSGRGHVQNPRGQGRGGERRRGDSSEEQNKHYDNSYQEGRGRGRGYIRNSRGRGRLGGGGESSRGESTAEQDNKQTEVEGIDNTGNQRGRGRRGGGGGGGRSNHYRKDRAMKKHFSGLSGL